MDNEKITVAILAAQKAAEAASPEMKEKAFEVVLAHLLGSSLTPVTTVPRAAIPNQAAAPLATANDGSSIFDASRVATQLGISAEQVSELFEMKGDTLHLTVKPEGKTIGDKQRVLAHALMVGYRFGLDTKEIPITVFNDAADEWGIRDSNIGRVLKSGRDLQMKGGGRGKRPLFSLAPGAIERVRDGIVALLN
jgi:hypothetical protein